MGVKNRSTRGLSNHPHACRMHDMGHGSCIYTHLYVLQLRVDCHCKAHACSMHNMGHGSCIHTSIHLAIEGRLSLQGVGCMRWGMDIAYTHPYILQLKVNCHCKADACRMRDMGHGSCIHTSIHLVIEGKLSLQGRCM